MGIGIGDRVVMLEYTWYSVISPESCSSILWRNWDNKEKAAEALKLTASDMHHLKLVDAVLKEPVGGAHCNPQKVFSSVKSDILRSLNKFDQIEREDLVKKRIEKFCSMGVFNE